MASKELKSAIINIIVSYVLLFFLCAISVFVLIYLTAGFALQPQDLPSAKLHDGFLLYTAKIIKMWSFFFIFSGILGWMLDLPTTDPNIKAHKVWGTIVGTVTLIVAIYMAIRVFAYVVEYDLKVYYLLDDFIALMPLIFAAIANWNLMNGGDGPVYCSFRRFFYLVYVPVLSAGGTILLVCVGLEKLVRLDALHLPVLVSGAMAFLVFVTHCSEKVVHHFEALPLTHGSAILRAATPD